MDPETVKREVSCLRASFRQYLLEELTSGRMDVEKAKEMASVINVLVNHSLQTSEGMDKVLEQLVGQFPELAQATGSVRLGCQLQEDKTLIDDYVIKEIEQGRLDKALEMMETLKKENVDKQVNH